MGVACILSGWATWPLLSPGGVCLFERVVREGSTARGRDRSPDILGRPSRYPRRRHRRQARQAAVCVITDPLRIGDGDQHPIQPEGAEVAALVSRFSRGRALDARLKKGAED
jgi:hypothetical protein